MNEFKAYDPNVEVLGDNIGAFMQSFPNSMQRVGLEILEGHGIHSPVSGQWYSLQLFLDSMKEISDRFGSHVLTRIGERIAGTAKLPPDLDSLEKCLESIDVAFHMNHRGGEIGNYEYHYDGKQGGLHRARMICPNCYPCDFDRGLLEGFCNRFKPEESAGIVVRHDDTEACRQKGEKYCVYNISWG